MPEEVHLAVSAAVSAHCVALHGRHGDVADDEGWGQAALANGSGIDGSTLTPCIKCCREPETRWQGK